MPSKVFVANLPSDVRESELKDEFSKFGNVSDVKLKLQGRVPFGFVEFEEDGAAEEAVKGKNGFVLSNHTLRVEIANGRTPRPDRGTKYGPPKHSNYRLEVTHLPYRCSWQFYSDTQDLKDHMRREGDVGYCVVRGDIGYVEYVNFDDMMNALKYLDDTKCVSGGESSYIRVRRCRSRSPSYPRRSRSRSRGYPRRSRSYPRRSRSRSGGRRFERGDSRDRFPERRYSRDRSPPRNDSRNRYSERRDSRDRPMNRSPPRNDSRDRPMNRAPPRNDSRDRPMERRDSRDARDSRERNVDRRDSRDSRERPVSRSPDRPSNRNDSRNASQERRDSRSRSAPKGSRSPSHSSNHESQERRESPRNSRSPSPQEAKD